MPWCPAVRVIYKPSLCEFYFVILLRFLQKDSFEMLKLLIKSSSDSQLKSLMELYIIPLLGRLYLPCSRHGNLILHLSHLVSFLFWDLSLQCIWCHFWEICIRSVIEVLAFACHLSLKCFELFIYLFFGRFTSKCWFDLVVPWWNAFPSPAKSLWSNIEVHNEVCSVNGQDIKAGNWTNGIVQHIFF